MAAFSIQKRELLVDGFIREQENSLRLSNIIPKSINLIIFEFQLLVDIWNKKWSHPKVNINDNRSIVEISKDDTFDDFPTIYGDHIVKYDDSFSWHLEIIKGKDCKSLIGIMPNKEEILSKYNANQLYNHVGVYLWAVPSGYIFHNATASKYSRGKSFCQKGDQLEIKFNWKQNILQYIFNGEDFGNALDVCSIQEKDQSAEFRLAICVKPSQDNDIAIKIHSQLF